MSSQPSANTWLFFPTLQNYIVSKQLVSDTIAGLTVGSLAVPQSMSYAMIAGLPVQNGLYSDLQVAYPILGSSRHLVVGPVAIMSLLTMSALKGTGVEPLTFEWIVLCSLLSFCVGVFQLALSLLRVGSRLSNAISENTVKAFTACAALTIASTQIQALLGVKKCPKEGCGFFHLIEVGLFENPNVETLIISAASLGILEGIRYVCSPSSLLSKMGSLIVLLFGCLVGFTLRLNNVQTIGFIPQGLPSSSPISSFFAVPTKDHLYRIAAFTVPIALIGFAEAFAIARSRSDPNYPTTLNPNRELAALGIANVWTAFLGGYACTGSFSRSAVNAEAGSTSGVSNFVAALLVILVLQVLTGPLSYLPKACVSSVVISAILRLCDFKYVQELYYSQSWKQLGLYLTVFGLGLGLGVEIGLLAGFIIDTLDYFVSRRWGDVHHQQQHLIHPSTTASLSSNAVQGFQAIPQTDSNADTEEGLRPHQSGGN